MTAYGCSMALMMAVSIVGAASADEAKRPGRPKCRFVHASLVEDHSTVGCEPPSTSCFLGRVQGTHGLFGTTRFDGDSHAPGPSTSPGFIIYSGKFEYFTHRGTLVARETGVTQINVPSNESGAVTAYQKITEATGEWTGATGYFFVSGFNTNNHVVTKVSGRICLP